MLAIVLGSEPVCATTEPGLENAATVNEGSLHFPETVPSRPPHHHQNHIRIDRDSLSSGWVSLSQCHDDLDAVPRTRITFREGFVRDPSSAIERRTSQ